MLLIQHNEQLSYGLGIPTCSQRWIALYYCHMKGQDMAFHVQASVPLLCFLTLWHCQCGWGRIQNKFYSLTNHIRTTRDSDVRRRWARRRNPPSSAWSHLWIAISGCDDLIIWHYLVVSNFFFLHHHTSGAGFPFRTPLDKDLLSHSEPGSRVDISTVWQDLTLSSGKVLV